MEGVYLIADPPLQRVVIQIAVLTENHACGVELVKVAAYGRRGSKLEYRQKIPHNEERARGNRDFPRGNRQPERTAGFGHSSGHILLSTIYPVFNTCSRACRSDRCKKSRGRSAILKACCFPCS